MAEREARAARALPKTGIAQVDQEAVVVQACLTRIADHAAWSGLGTADRKTKGVTKVIGSPQGASVDISGRTEMGREPPSQNPTLAEGELLPERTDSVIAQSALLRLLRAASGALLENDALNIANRRMRAEAAELRERVAALEADVGRLQSELATYTDPNAAYQLYKNAWRRQHDAGQLALTRDAESKQRVLQQLLERKVALRHERKLVLAKKMLFQATDAQLEEEFAADETMIENMMNIFNPAPINVEVTKEPTVALPDFGLDRMLRVRSEMTGGSGASRATTPRHTRPSSAVPQGSAARPSSGAAAHGGQTRRAASAVVLAPVVAGQLLHAEAAATQPLLAGVGARRVSVDDDTVTDDGASPLVGSDEVGGAGDALSMAIKDLDIDRVLDRVDELLDDNQDTDDVKVGKKAAAQHRKPNAEGQSSEMKTEEIVITRYINSGERVVRIQDSSNTLIGVLMSIFAFAPSTYSALNIDMLSTVGRRDQLQRQSRSFGIEPLWDEAQLYESPTVLVVECRTPTDADVSVPFLRDDGVAKLLALPSRDPWRDSTMTCDDEEQLTAEETEVRRQRMEKLLQFKRLGPGKQDPRNYMLPHAHDDDVASVTLKQYPGVISHIAHGFGESTAFESPIRSGLVRCYASSMAKACNVENLITPFFDFRTPYFSTDDAPGQYVAVAFSNMFVIPSGYSMASTHPIHGGFYPRNWRFEGSNDGESWTLLRRHVNDETLSRYRPTYFFEISIPPATQSRHFSHFRVLQEGVNAMGTHELNVSAIEVYGRLMHVRAPIVRSALLLPSRPLRRRGFQVFSALPEMKNTAKKGGAAKKKK